MKLHENDRLFRQSVQFTADQFNIPAIYIEKDYWVTYALKLIFNGSLKDEIVFKGGTSLSKCFKLIDRFSEDIDLVILRKEGESNNRMGNKLREISTSVGQVLHEVHFDGITNKKGMNRKTAHSYGKKFKGEFGQAREFIVLESSWLGHHEPFTSRTIASMTGEMIMGQNQLSIAKEFDLLPFEVQVLDPERTFCEKIMSLIRFSYEKEPLAALKNKIRHFYDLERLLKRPEYLNFLHSPRFDELILRVANDDVISFKNNNQWLNNHPRDSLVFRDLGEVWEELKEVYRGSFAMMIYGNLPDEKDIFAAVSDIRDRISEISWTITVPH